MTHAAIIKALGDTRYLAETLGRPVSTVANWKERGVPWHWRPTVAKLATERRVPLPADFLTPTP